MPAWWMELRRTAVDAVRTLVLGPEQSGTSLLADLLRTGTRGWAWLLLLLATIGTAFVFTLPGVSSQVRDGLAHPAGAGLLTLWTAFLWLLLTATAGNLQCAFRLLVAIYGLLYFGTPLFSAAGGPQLVLVPALVLLLFERTHPRSALASWPGRILWVLFLAQFPPHPIHPFLLSLGLKALLGIGLVSLPIWRSVRIPQMARGGLLALGLMFPYLVAWGSQPEATGEAIQQMLASLWGLSTPVWLWLGADLVEEGGRLGHFCSRRITLLRAYPHLFRALPFLILALGVLALLAFWPEPGMEFWMHLGMWVPFDLYRLYLDLYRGIWHAVRDWPPDAYLAGRTVVGVLIVLGLAGLWLRRRMEPLAFGQQYVALIIGSVAFLFTFYQAFFEVLDVELPQQWWPLLLMIVACTWEPLKALQELREGAKSLLEWIVAAGLLLLTIVIARQLTDPEKLVRDTTLWPLLGAMVWGFPYLLFTDLQTARGVEEERTISPVRPFLLGYVLMLPLASTLPLEDRYLPPLAFLLGSLMLPPPRGSWIARWMHGAWIGLGAVAFQVVPWLLVLPILPLMQGWLERLYSRMPLDFLSTAYFIQAAGALLAALFLAVWVGIGRRRRIGGLLGALLWGLWSAYVH